MCGFGRVRRPFLPFLTLFSPPPISLTRSHPKRQGTWAIRKASSPCFLPWHEMGGKGGAPSPSPASSSVVCCMCGDHGLSEELFRCKICHVRSQHKYCSDLYLKTETHRACNWCLREEGARCLPQESTQDHSTNSATSPSSSSSTNNGGLGLRLQRGGFASHLMNKPIKKQRTPERSPSDAVESARAAELSPAGLGRTRHAFRGKVRRYKLLEEVSS